jgi:hypothetical protein
MCCPDTEVPHNVLWVKCGKIHLQIHIFGYFTKLFSNLKSRENNRAKVSEL